ncbi:MAG TPA: aldo/keto reductase [Xanthobacteraceae bacterium]|nr:aldo/keto reductase [Xanthobacteraceae bacterium]
MTDISAFPKRQLGKSGIAVAPVGLGCMSLSGAYGPSSDDDGIALVHAAIDSGVTLIDTSDMYGAGHNEKLLARALKGRRDKVVLATKFGNLGGKDGKYADGRPEFVVQSCDASLERLEVDVIDLYYQHRIDPSVPIEDTVGAVKKLIEAGKVRAFGLCEARPATIRRAHKVHPVAAVQNEFSLLYRVEAEETLPTLRELGISFVPYSPIGRGMLSASIPSASALANDDPRRRHPRYAGDNLAVNLDLVSRITTVAKEKGCTPAQLALAWLLARGNDIIPIPGTRRKDRLAENLGALNVKLSDADVKRLSDAIPVGAAAGTRYPEAQLASLYI